MNKNQLFYVGLKRHQGTYTIYVSDRPLDGIANSYTRYMNEIPLRKNHWRSAVKHYIKYNLYDYFFKSAVERSLDTGAYPNSISEEGGLGNMSKHLKENKDKIKSDVKATMEFLMEKDDKDDYKVIRI